MLSPFHSAHDSAFTKRACWLSLEQLRAYRMQCVNSTSVCMGGLLIPAVCMYNQYMSFTYVCMHVCMYVCMYVCVYVCVMYVSIDACIQQYSECLPRAQAPTEVCHEDSVLCLHGAL